MAFNLEKAVRPNILALVPYRCGRDDYPDDGINVLLDTNENSIGPALPEIDPGFHLNRYPDPRQPELKQRWCDLRMADCHTAADGLADGGPLEAENVFLGTGSDEAIDAVMRCFCTPGRDAVLVCPPTYGMYAVTAQVNDLPLVRVPLGPAPRFSLDVPAMQAALRSGTGPPIKAVYLCTPGNPTASSLAPADIAAVLAAAAAVSAVVVLDEAYVDFAPPRTSLAGWVRQYDNLVVLQTLSKAWGLAGLRLGAAFAPAPIARLLNSIRAPYNIASPSAALARRTLEPPGVAAVAANVARLAAQRDRLCVELPRLPGIGRMRGGLDANFLLFEILGPSGHPDVEVAREVYRRLASDRHIVVRFRGTEHNCDACLRITVGTEDEVPRLLAELKDVLAEVRGTGVATGPE